MDSTPPIVSFYEILEVSPQASTEVINASFAAIIESLDTRLSAGEDPTAIERERRQAMRAHLSLSDAARRRQYDKMLTYQRAEAIRAASGMPPSAVNEFGETIPQPFVLRSIQDPMFKTAGDNRQAAPASPDIAAEMQAKRQKLIDETLDSNPLSTDWVALTEASREALTTLRRIHDIRFAAAGLIVPGFARFVIDTLACLALAVGAYSSLYLVSMSSTTMKAAEIAITFLLVGVIVYSAMRQYRIARSPLGFHLLTNQSHLIATNGFDLETFPLLSIRTIQIVEHAGKRSGDISIEFRKGQTRTYRTANLDAARRLQMAINVYLKRAMLATESSLATAIAVMNRSSLPLPRATSQLTTRRIMRDSLISFAAAFTFALGFFFAIRGTEVHTVITKLDPGAEASASFTPAQAGN